MTDAKLPRPPRDLGHRGRAFWRSMHAQYEVTGVEAELLVEVCRTLDSVERLAGEDPDGAGLRAQRALLGRLMNTLMRDTGLSSVHAQTAARARWGRPGLRPLTGTCAYCGSTGACDCPGPRTLEELNADLDDAPCAHCGRPGFPCDCPDPRLTR